MNKVKIFGAVLIVSVSAFITVLATKDQQGRASMKYHPQSRLLDADANELNFSLLGHFQECCHIRSTVVFYPE